ncbi:MAG: zinc ribbon domain-containing protein [Firmicutes bacterium]|nr:zinc ribbon domain-containing protein [Bacillota bacterium]
MPLYEFKCPECGREFEELCPLGATSWPCPNCKSENTIRKISRFSAKSAGENGTTKSIGGNKCGSCHGNCSSCH